MLGEVKMGWIYKDEYVEKKLKMGDVNFIPAGSAFYMVNTGIGQRLQIICSIDASQTIGFNSYHVNQAHCFGSSSFSYNCLISDKFFRFSSRFTLLEGLIQPLSCLGLAWELLPLHSM